MCYGFLYDVIVVDYFEVEACGMRREIDAFVFGKGDRVM